jgi:hypothetical protein
MSDRGQDPLMCKIRMTREDARVLLGNSADDIGLIDLCTKSRHRWLAGPWVRKIPRPALTGLNSAPNVIFTDNPHVAFKVLLGPVVMIWSHEEPIRSCWTASPSRRA